MEHQAEFYFNVQGGTLLVGQLAVMADIAAGAHPADIRSLPELLAGPERIVGPKVFEPIPYIKPDTVEEGAAEKTTNIKKWDGSEDVITAKWLHGVVKQYSPEKVLSEEVIIRAGYLNLLPRIKYFKSRDGGLVGLYRDAKLENTRTRSLFDHWTTEDYVNYIRKLAQKKGDKPSGNDIEAASRQVGNPSVNQICGRFGRLGTLLELAGYVHVLGWSRDDFIDWGVRFMEANDGKLPNSRTMAILSVRHLGPSFKSIYERDDFESMYDFQTECIFAYERKMQYKKQLRETQLEEIYALLPNDKILNALAAGATNEQDLIRLFAKYKLVREYESYTPKKEIIRTCRAKSSKGLVSLIMRSTEDVTAADIETQAEILGLHDTIWPMSGYLQNLNVA